MRIVAEFSQTDAEAVTRTLEWAADLNGSSISSVTWTVPSGITSESQTTSGTTSSIRLSGGTAGTTYTVSALMTTAAAEDLEAGFTLLITE